MDWIQKRKKMCLAALLAGILAAGLLVSGFSGEFRTREKNSVYNMDREIPLVAWWGSLYPKWCFAERSDQGKDRNERKISFWLAKVLDW